MAEDVADRSDDLPQSLSSRLTDVGSYSYSALCAVSLVQLFEDKWHKDFKKKTIEMVLKHLDIPNQVKESILYMVNEELTCCDDPKPFADALLQESCLKENGLPVITDLMTLGISDGIYDARMRVIIKHIAWQLRISWDHVEDIESMMAETLEARQYKMSERTKHFNSRSRLTGSDISGFETSMRGAEISQNGYIDGFLSQGEEVDEKKKKQRNAKIKRFALIGLATVGGGALIGLTGGLAAPLVAAGTASIIGGAGAAALGSTAGVAVIGSLFGVAGAGLTGFKMKKRVGAIEEFAFEPLLMMGKQLHITIAVTGWLSKEVPDFKMPWQTLAESREQYSIRWESKYLLEMGKAMDYLLNGALSMATQEALKYTILAGIITAVAWPSALLAASSVIDNPWSVCIQRANASGKELAEVLLAREQGNRPVTLVGFSLGAKVIFSCLEELSKRKGGEGIVEDVILLGAPVTGDPKSWARLAGIISGKIINGYSRGDWLLKFLYRTASVQFKNIAGLGPVKWDNRRMHNIDLSDIVAGHKDYMKHLPTILKVVGVRTKEDMVIGQVPAHKLFPRENSCDSFTSSEGEEDEDDEQPIKTQKAGNHRNSNHGDEKVKEVNVESQSCETASSEEVVDEKTGSDLVTRVPPDNSQEVSSGEGNNENLKEESLSGTSDTNNDTQRSSKSLQDDTKLFAAANCDSETEKKEDANKPVTMATQKGNSPELADEKLDSIDGEFDTLHEELEC